jgi:hypothetical protein
MLDAEGRVRITNFGLAAIAGYGFCTSFAGRPLFGESLLQE